MLLLKATRRATRCTGSLLLAGVCAASLMVFASSTGCESDDEVGRTRTTTTRTVDTPTEKKTITETREKDTRYVPR